MKVAEYNEIIYYIGENAKDNWDILDNCIKINEMYIWFHLNSFPSCYVIMCSTIEQIKETDINNYLYYGAELCKNNSKYRNYSNLKIIYTTLNKLKKTNNVGEVIISGKKNKILI